LFASAGVAQTVRDGLIFEPVDPGLSDVGPLALSQRILRADLRVPTAFERVYRVKLPDGSSVFARIDNGVTAVFPRSDYVSTSQGVFAVVPPGTVYSIGGDIRSIFAGRPAPAQAPPPVPSASLFADRSLNRSLKQVPVRTRPDSHEVNSSVTERPLARASTLRAETRAVSIWTSELVRQRRIDALLGD